MSVQAAIDRAKARAAKRSQLKVQEKMNRRSQTILNFQEAEERIVSLNIKIERLTRERDNLLRKQETRKEYLNQEIEK